MYAGVPVQYLPNSFPKQYFRARKLVNVLKAQAQEHDLLHLHGCWNVLSWHAAHLCQAWQVPYISWILDNGY
jgi:hypothetical protein